MASKRTCNPQTITSQIDGQAFMVDIDLSRFLGLGDRTRFIWDAFEAEVTVFLDTRRKDKMAARVNG